MAYYFALTNAVHRARGAAAPPRCRQTRARKLARVHMNHVELEGRYYSVPYHLVRERVELRFDGHGVILGCHTFMSEDEAHRRICLAVS